MSKKSYSCRFKGATSGKAWKMLLDGKSYKEIGEAIGHTTTAVKTFAGNKYRKEADKLWSLQIRSVGSCEICGTTIDQLNAHHILEKSVWLNLRHDLSNGICLCVQHHTFSRECCPHGNLPAVQAFMDWIKEYRPGVWEWYLEHKEDKRRHEVDYEAAYLELKAMSNV